MAAIINFPRNAIGPIVVATDFSAAADAAVARGLAVARALGAELCLLHVFDDGVWRSLLKVFEVGSWHGDEPALAARSELSRRAAALSEASGLAVRAECLVGDTADQIAQYTVSVDARLLVIGRRGEDVIGDLIVGSTALNVLAQSRVPLLLAGDHRGGDYARVAVATDCGEAGARLAGSVAALFPNSRHVLMHAYAVPFEGRMRLAGATDADIQTYRARERSAAEGRLHGAVAALGTRGQAFEPLLVQGFAAPTILQEASALQADLIALGRHGDRLGERLLGSVTQNVLHHARGDVLIVP
jgi:nucleotide-binding universal stress UspA family protein